MRSRTPFTVGAGHTGKIFLCLLVCLGSTQLVLSSDDARIQIAFRDNEIQIGTDVTKPFFMQWRTPSSRDWVNWTEATLPDPSESCVWMRAIFESEDPFEWDLPTDVQGVYYPMTATGSDAPAVAWVPIGLVNDNGSFTLLSSADAMSAEIASYSVSAPSDAPRNNQAMATPDPGTSRLFWQSSDGLTVAWGLSDTGLKKSGTLCYPTSIGSNWKIEAAGDINRDGNTDVVMRRLSDGTIIYWMLAPDGYKESGGVVSTAVGANWVIEASGDIDRDGTMDLVMRRQSDGMIIYWLLNQDGTKKSGGTVSAAVGANWVVEASGDIDRDGTMDLVMRRQTDGMIIYWLLNQDGTKKSGGTVSTAVGANWVVEASGDIDRDGTMDLVMRRQTDGLVIYWLLNQDGTKKSGGTVAAALGSNWTVQGATDIDKDGTVDLIISRTDNLPIYWLLNQDGTKKSGGTIQGTAVGSNWDIQQVSMN